MSQAAPPILGHVHLRVSDLDRAIAFYRGVIGLEVTQLYGDQAAFLASQGYHHHIGLNTWASRGAAPAPGRHPGLFHTASSTPTGRASAPRSAACSMPASR